MHYGPSGDSRSFGSFTRNDAGRLKEKRERCVCGAEELPELVDKRGVLVVKSDATGDLADAVVQERGRRLSDLMRLLGL